MSIKTKVLLILSLVLISYAGLCYGIQRFVVFPSFVTLQKEQATRNLERCEEALKREILHLDALCHDWASWDDTYRFVNELNSEYIEATLVPTTFKNAAINLVHYYSTAGELLWGKTIDLKTMGTIDLGSLGSETSGPLSALLAPTKNESHTTGILSTEYGLFLVASRPILTSNEEGPVRGTLIMGRLLDEKLVKELIDQTRIGFHILPVQKHSLSLRESAMLKRLAKEPQVFIDNDEKGVLQAFTTFRDIQGSAAFFLCVDTPKQITAKGNAALEFALLSIALAGIITVIVTLFLLKKSIVSPISELTKWVLEIIHKFILVCSSYS